MHLTEGEIYHVYNRGNNRQRIFFSPRNYSYFLQGVQKYLSFCCDIFAWCLMPNHFHFLVHANNSSTRIVKDRGFERQQFSQGIKMLLSSYTKAINKQRNRTGSLFQQKTKGLWVSEPANNFALTVFHYIHQNPVRAGLVSKMEDWEYSSFKEYAGSKNETLCNKNLTQKYLGLDFTRLYVEEVEVSYPFKEVPYTLEV